MDSLRQRAGERVEAWPPGGLAVGLLADPSTPRWAGRAALELALAAADCRKPPLILDLAPKETDLSSRFGAADEEGFAELVDGELELWEIVHRHAEGGAFYLPCGLRSPGADLARSSAARTLAERVRSRGRILLAPLDRTGAGAAASAGWVDGFVRLGDRGVSSARLSGDAEMLGDLQRVNTERESAPGESAEERGGGGKRASRRETDGEKRGETSSPERSSRGPELGSSSPRLALPRRRRRSGAILRRAVGTVLAAAVVLAAGVTASGWLGGPGWAEVRDVVGAVGEATPALQPPGSGADSAASGSEAAPPGAGDSASLPAPSSGDSAAPSAR